MYLTNRLQITIWSIWSTPIE